jgi:t-SNARE complex subunit (syntaxin)
MPLNEAENARIERLEKFNFGNGQPGADERLRNLESTQSEIRTGLQTIGQKVDSLVEDQKAARNQWKGAKITLIALAFIVSAVFGTGSFWIVKAIQALPFPP